MMNIIVAGHEMNYMNNNVFLDTNILIYSVDKRCLQKQLQAIHIIELLQKQHRAFISTQVLQ